MEQLNCVFVPMVFSELYRALAREKRYAQALEDQLASIHLTLGWLDEAADAYDRKWNADLAYLTPADVADYALSEQHSQFATWVLSGLYASGACAELATNLATSVTTRALGDVDELKGPLPPALSPTIIGWTLGSIIGIKGSDIPVAPAVRPSDENVRAAFDGLIEHVLTLQAMPEPWPEMMQTAMYWRGYGLAEALRPDAGSGTPALNQLRRETAMSMAGAQGHVIGRHLDSFGNRRNALSHIADDQSRPRFVDVIDDERKASGIDLTMRAMTQFVFHEVTKEVRDSPPAVVRPRAWEAMEYEIQVWT